MDKTKIRIVLIVISALLFVYSSLAIYKNRANTDILVAAATWSVSLNQNNVNNTLSIVPDPNGSTASYTLNITSQSEVDIVYNVVIDDLPSGVSIQLDDGSFVPESNGEVIFGNAGTILYSDVNKTKTHTLTFKAASGSPYVTNNEVNVNVITRQVT